MRNVLDTCCIENQNKNFVFCNFFSKNLALYEITWKNMEKPETTDDNIIRRLRVACWITKATHKHTHSEILRFLFFCDKNNFASPSHYYVIRTFSVLFIGFMCLTLLESLLLVTSYAGNVFVQQVFPQNRG